MASPSAPPAQQHELPWPAGGAQASSSLDEAQRQQQAEHGHADGAAPSGCPASEHADDHCTAWQLATAEAAAGALRQYGGGRGDGMLRAPMPFVQQLTASEAGASLHRLLTPCTVPVPMPLMRHAHSMEPYQPMEHHHGRHLLPHNCGSTPSPRSSIDEHGHMSVGGWSRGTDAPATAAPMPLHPLPLPGPTVLCCKRTANGLVDGGPELARLSLERSHSASTAVLMGGSRNGGASLDRDPRQHGAQRGSGGGGGQQQQQPGSSATFGTVSSDHYRQQQQQQQQRAGNGAGSGNGGVSGAHGIERPRSVNSLDKPRGGSGNTGLGGVWGWPGSGVGAVGGGGGGGTRQQRESFDRNSRSYSLELSGRHGRCGQQVGRGGQGSGRGGGRGSSAGQSPLSYSSHAGGHHQHQRDHHTFGGGAGFPSRGGGGGTGFPSRGSSPALSSYARSSVAVEYEPPPPGQPPAGIVRAVAAGDAPCVPPTTDLQRLLAQVTPRLALDPSKPLGAALSELTLEDVWRFYYIHARTRVHWYSCRDGRQACAGPTPAADNGDDGESAGSCRVDGGEGCADAAGAPPEGDQQQQQVVGTELPIAAGEPPIATGEPPGEAAGAAGAEASLPPSPLLPTTVPLHVVGLQWCNLHGERWLDVPSAEGSGLAGGGNGHGGKRSAAQRHLDTQWFSYLGELQYTAAWLSHGRGLQLLGQMGGGDAEPGVRHPDFEFFSSRP
ncbi:hypothetical protein FOA52_010453 [Chlamydomonas sp. UWO 241]|nr:hypothetical protein FOA52_010453 [Chlamydomonas sp. UWO 241]